jgi:hypothetical protein
MQDDWAGTKMVVVDPVTQDTTAVSVFVASLHTRAWCSHMAIWMTSRLRGVTGIARRSRHFGGVSQVIVPDDASTASNRISKADRACESHRQGPETLEQPMEGGAQRLQDHFRQTPALRQELGKTTRVILND